MKHNIKSLTLLLLTLMLASTLAVLVNAETLTCAPDDYTFDDAKNIATSASIAACSGFVNDGEAPEMLIDGDVSTKWCGTRDSRDRTDEYEEIRARGFLQYVTLDLGGMMYFDAYRLYQASNCDSDAGKTNYDAVSWAVEISSDGKDFEVIHEMNDNAASINEMYLGTRYARYVRLLVMQTNENDDGTVRMPEMMIFSCDEGETVDCGIFDTDIDGVLSQMAEIKAAAEAEAAEELPDSYVFESAGDLTKSDEGTVITSKHVVGIVLCAVLSLAIGAAACYNSVKHR